MTTYSEHFDAVRAKAVNIKPPSKLRLVGASFLGLFSLFAFVVALVSFVIFIILFIFHVGSGFLYGLSKFSFWSSCIGWFFFFYLIRSYKKQLGRFKNTEILRRDFKLDILPEIITEKYSDIDYRFDGIVDEAHILESDFFSPSLLSSLKERWFFGDDYFSGNLENVEFEFCELYYKTTGIKPGGWAVIGLIFAIAFRTNLDFIMGFLDFFGSIGDLDFSDKNSVSHEQSLGKGRGRVKVDEKAFFYGTQTNFKGFFLYADFHKNFEGTVHIRTKKKFASRKMFNFSKKLKRLRIENRSVNKKYIVEASDTQMGYYVLSPSIIEAIENLNKRLGRDLSMTLKDGKLYLIAPMSKDFFENIIIGEDEIQVNTIEDIHNDLNVIKNLITELNISNRIWTKV
ncbi:DUF3137 domain-containing protein [Zobellia galactanivorans]|uniref:DUF3137 domain-containing protein n=1 Tax=Zobellia galactanivorans (strain DSM 12802 / CCUG 47099 / CIP 106680 / NCIMB 13871 / Dsij) TaxID=63186 RepID=UPI001C065581|nr:DUF3137 domain-containing protein [Zobellia galactanivorans]MBU3027558.1 DUF3137 domain-containing protein [Zobellia galactanivorans]MDO6810778.1 DUF3137 domain-containing protein [Zobellia galactanivorans]